MFDMIDPALPTLLGGAGGVVGLLIALTRAATAVKDAAGKMSTLVGAVSSNTTATETLAKEFKAYRQSTTEALTGLDERVSALEGAFPKWPDQPS